jgi:hypothetical protein
MNKKRLIKLAALTEYELGRDASGQIPPEFWDHLEIVTGVKQNKRPNYFSCSC